MKIAWIRTHHLQWKFKLWAGKFAWDINNCCKCSQQTLENKKQSNVLPLHLEQIFPSIILFFTEGDGIKSRLPFIIFSTLNFVHTIKVKNPKYWIKKKLPVVPVPPISEGWGASAALNFLAASIWACWDKSSILASPMGLVGKQN